MRRAFQRLDEPNMSDSTLLLKVEDLISMALGPKTQNLVNFKHMQTVLFMLARQLRMLEQQVEIRICESEEEIVPEVKKSEKKMRKRKTLQDQTGKKDTGFDKKGKKHKDTDETDEDTEVSGRGTKKKTGKSDEKQKKETEKTLDKEKKVAAKDIKSIEREKSPGDKRTPADKDITSSDKEKQTGYKEKLPGDKKVPEDEGKVPGEKERLAAIKEKADQEKKYAEKVKKQKIKAGISDSSIDYRDRKSRKSTGRAHVGNVEVVTQAEFAGLEAAVRQLEQLASHPPGLTMPDNQTLRDDLLHGTASLTEAMHTMQVNARVQAAEEAIGRMAGLLTQLAAAGALPAQLAAALRDGRIDLSAPGLGDLQQILLRQRKETARATGAWQTGPTGTTLGTMEGERAVDAATEPAAPPEPEPAPPPPALPTGLRDPSAPVTVVEFDSDLVTELKTQMSFEIQQITSKANSAADNAIKTAQFVAEKLEPAMGMAERINVLRILVADYADQLNGFDAGLSTQMQGFQEQMNQMRTELKSGLEQLAAVNNNSEATALAELTARYEDMVVGLDDVNTTHQALYTVQSKLSDELRNLVESVEMLRDQKSDRDEVLDALRDKADISRLAGLLTEEKFAEAHGELERMLDICQDKFKRQDKTWIRALEDIEKALEMKAEQTELMSSRQDVEARLQELHDLLQRLEEQLGDPIAALLMRRLGRGAVCGACGTSALMTPGVPPQPPELPALPAPHTARRPVPAADADSTQVCVPHPHVEDVKTPVRWCGGEHTIRSQLRQRARPPPRTPLTTRPYIGVGVDGRTYHMEEELQPCMECNELLEPRKDAAGGEGGAGDA
ncbi:hypothetical protein RR48_08797 [Papilio machaon]|uniref:DUF4795 domain-containing protein n=1 Tax=Papilio machaon TaxID=76193 RepID=A0A194RMT1_PAPMA|nr:hypothetical protein RR48_08797 [Papilio machaon]